MKVRLLPVIRPAGPVRDALHPVADEDVLGTVRIADHEIRRARCERDPHAVLRDGGIPRRTVGGRPVARHAHPPQIRIGPFPEVDVVEPVGVRLGDEVRRLRHEHHTPAVSARPWTTRMTVALSAVAGDADTASVPGLPPNMSIRELPQAKAASTIETCGSPLRRPGAGVGRRCVATCATTRGPCGGWEPHEA